MKLAGENIRERETLVVDANKFWKPHEARRVLNATADIDYYIEQPCSTYEECVSVSGSVKQPMILDESLLDPRFLLRALKDDAFEGFGCKITRVGGLTGMRAIRDLCGLAGKIITCDDAWGGDLSTAATTHISVATSPSVFFSTYVSTDFSTIDYDPGASKVVNGSIKPNGLPGLGVSPDESLLTLVAEFK
ncbi:enolase C-terminal domain-like protein [Rhizobium ruizarguesonis]|uniref:enolase C-terminal domain-like protein n=1 Tax=Rhizobium ruizarguesonis TaxID=2081791 RepID=UPI0013BF719A|nr:enolase C-terminal domain-like protein [Rhizobium ruizarguesonis]NEI96469.1 hypothetical protein [Rhizobium ruizarguesonis]NEJ33908.1 hypothetical protein [Rhizobium ruizarguesonis]